MHKVTVTTIFRFPQWLSEVPKQSHDLNRTIILNYYINIPITTQFVKKRNAKVTYKIYFKLYMYIDI